MPACSASSTACAAVLPSTQPPHWNPTSMATLAPPQAPLIKSGSLARYDERSMGCPFARNDSVRGNGDPEGLRSAISVGDVRRTLSPAALHWRLGRVTPLRPLSDDVDAIRSGDAQARFSVHQERNSSGYWTTPRIFAAKRMSVLRDCGWDRS